MSYPKPRSILGHCDGQVFIPIRPRAQDIAAYFLAKDPYEIVFDDFSGEAKLCHFLHMAQNLHIAMKREPLFDTPMYAKADGIDIDGVTGGYEDLRTSFAMLAQMKVDPDEFFRKLDAVSVDECIKFSALRNMRQFSIKLTDFIDRVYEMFKSAEWYVFIDFCSEDLEWDLKHLRLFKFRRRMYGEQRVDEYVKLYADVVTDLQSIDLSETVR